MTRLIRRRVNLILIAVVLVVGADWLQPPRRQVTTRLVRGVLRVYQWTVSPVFAATGLVRCRYTPTCSRYCDLALAKHGLPKGALLTAWRLLRCAPWGRGGEDYP